MRTLGVRRLYFKRLAENDNSKQQVYLGGSFEVLKVLPFSDIVSSPGGSRPNFKAALDLSWLDDSGASERATGAQLILYPDYPEVRLSGFLRGCRLAPVALMRPVPGDSRRFNNGPDGRVLVLGATEFGRIFAYLAPAETTIARTLENRAADAGWTAIGVLVEIPMDQPTPARRAELLNRLAEVFSTGWHASVRRNAEGMVVPYVARNAAGYTLEAQFGITPHANSGPDFLGWELKAVGSLRITLMTPEPDGGYYGAHGVENFVRRFGHSRADDTIYFTGTHKVGAVCEATGQILRLAGFDTATAKIVDVSGGIELRDGNGVVSAAWSYSSLIRHWSKKHAAAAFVPYIRSEADPVRYKYGNEVMLGEGAEFPRYLLAMQNGTVVYDPGSKVSFASTARSRTKARNQFRSVLSRLDALYSRFERLALVNGNWEVRSRTG